MRISYWTSITKTMKNIIIIAFCLFLSSCAVNKTTYVAKQKPKKSNIKNNNDLKIMFVIIIGVALWTNDLNHPL